MQPTPTLSYQQSALHLLDQRVLPMRIATVVCTNAAQVARAITQMVVRGAPAIGVAAAYGMALEAARWAGVSTDRAHKALAKARATLAQSRPTAVNLAWALERCDEVIAKQSSATGYATALLQLAKRLHREDIAQNRRMGAHGAALLHTGTRILTHCNAGALATGGYGTALGVIRTAHAAGKIAHVWIDETRPFLQGARLTAWEMVQARIPATLICDNMAASLMQAGRVDAVIVGADRIAANGDVANKIGTYGLAVLARAHGLPFYVAAPWSTFDLSLKDGSQIPIEERAAAEMTGYFGKRWAPDGISVFNPAFDVTPAKLVTAIITEHGVIAQPNRAKLRHHGATNRATS